MKNNRNYISICVTALIAAGMFLSVFHTHFIENADDAQQVVITQDFNECAVCASHFKISSADIETDSAIFYPDIRPDVVPEPSADTQVAGIHNERDPPFVIRG